MKKTISLCVGFLLIGIVIFYFSSQPYSRQSLIPLFNEHLPHSWIEEHFSHISYNYAGNEISIENYGVSSFVEFHVRKGAHLFVFACFAVFAYIVLKRLTQKAKISGILSLFLTALYAVFDEFHQSLTPERTPAYQDVLLDITGAILGLGVFLISTNLISRIKNIHKT